MRKIPTVFVVRERQALCDIGGDAGLRMGTGRGGTPTRSSTALAC